jgi:hypothetical protein
MSIAIQRRIPLLPASFRRKVAHIGPPLLPFERKVMRLRLIPAACGMLLHSLGVPAHGVNCYQIWDARDNLLYQSIFPPFDLARPAFDREMASLRTQRRTFIFFDTSDCAITGSNLTGPQSGATSTDPASLLDIRTTIGTGYRGSSGGMLSPTSASTGPAPVSAPPVSTNVGGSTGTGMGTARSSGRY